MKLTYLVLSKEPNVLVKFFYEKDGKYAEFKMTFTKEAFDTLRPNDTIGVRGTVDVFSHNPEGSGHLIEAFKNAITITYSPMTFDEAAKIDTSTYDKEKAILFFFGMAPNDYMLHVTDMMAEYGGGFVKALADCYNRADGNNKNKLLHAFIEYFMKYTPDKWAKKEKEVK